MRPWPCETKWGARRSPLCISSFMKCLPRVPPLHTNIRHAKFGSCFAVSPRNCEQASDSLIRNLALINLINISVSVSQAPSSVFGTAVRAWRRQGKRFNKTADSPNRKPMSPLMSASRLHFFLPLLYFCGGTTVQSKSKRGPIARTCSLAVVRCSCGRCARSQIIRDIISSSRCHLVTSSSTVLQ